MSLLGVLIICVTYGLGFAGEREVEIKEKGQVLHMRRRVWLLQIHLKGNKCYMWICLRVLMEFIVHRG